MAAPELKHKRHSYCGVCSGSDELHTIDVWKPDDLSKDGLWVVYIHGGAWRDPEIDAMSFKPAVTALWNSPARGSIAGFASLNYRLSPYPSHPTNPSSLDDCCRNVHYPSHVDDVEGALTHLGGLCNLSGGYLLVGHSAGATMAFEMNKKDPLSGTGVPDPIGVLGIAGIYHFEAFLENHSQSPVYREFMENAFPNRELWEKAAPYTNREPGFAIWENAKAVIIAHSEDDELIEKEQASFMLERGRLTPRTKDKVHFLQAKGCHDEIWESGHILADLITKSLKILGLKVK